MPNSSGLGRNDRFKLASLELLLRRGQPGFSRQAAVMAGHLAFAQLFFQNRSVCQPAGLTNTNAACVCGLIRSAGHKSLANQLGHTATIRSAALRSPDPTRVHAPCPMIWRSGHRQRHCPLLREIAATSSNRLLVAEKTDSNGRFAAQLIESRPAKDRCETPLVSGQGVDLVDDYRSHVCESNFHGLSRLS